MRWPVRGQLPGETQSRTTLVDALIVRSWTRVRFPPPPSFGSTMRVAEHAQWNRTLGRCAQTRTLTRDSDALEVAGLEAYKHGWVGLRLSDGVITGASVHP